MKTLANNELTQVTGGELVNFRDFHGISDNQMAPCVMVEVSEQPIEKQLEYRARQAVKNLPGAGIIGFIGLFEIYA